MAQVNPVLQKRAAGIDTSALMGRPLTRQERDQYRFIKRALRNPANQPVGVGVGVIASAGDLSCSDQQVIQRCLTLPNFARS